MTILNSDGFFREMEPIDYALQAAETMSTVPGYYS